MHQPNRHANRLICHLPVKKSTTTVYSNNASEPLHCNHGHSLFNLWPLTPIRLYIHNMTLRFACKKLIPTSSFKLQLYNTKTSMDISPRTRFLWSLYLCIHNNYDLWHVEPKKLIPRSWFWLQHHTEVIEHRPLYAIYNDTVFWPLYIYIYLYIQYMYRVYLNSST